MNTSGFSAVVKQIYQYEEVKCIEMHLLSSEVSTIEITKVGHNLALFQACSRKKKGIETRTRAHYLCRGSS